MRGLSIEINLISLGAMALAVGMVVDGAIVVLENTARHLKKKKPKSFNEKIEVIMTSVSEVKSAIISSLLTTIIVFLPLSFTAPLANAILGDLARVMVCVLVLSVVVTIYLIPPLINSINTNLNQSSQKGFYAISFYFKKKLISYLLKKKYITSLEKLINSPKTSYSLFLALLVVLAFSIWILSTKIKKEIIARPNSDKIFLAYNFAEGEVPINEAATLLEENIESIIEKDFKKYLRHYVTKIYKHGGHILFMLKDKSESKKFKEALENQFKNTPRFYYHVWSWNPTALKIPREELFNIQVTSKEDSEKRRQLKLLQSSVKHKKLVPLESGLI